MRSRSGIILGLLLLAMFGAAGAARAQDAVKDPAPSAAPTTPPNAAPNAPQNAAQDTAPDAAQSCEVPAYLLTSDSPLSKVAEAVKDAHVLNVLVVGSRSSTIPMQEASAYPARLQALFEGETALGHS